MVDVFGANPFSTFSTVGLHMIKLVLSGGTPALYQTINAIVYLDVLASEPVPTPTRTVPAPQSQREAIKIPDEVELLINFIKDRQLNHLLRLIVPDDNILTKAPTEFIRLPAIVVQKVAFASKIKAEPIPPDGNIGNVWYADIEIALVSTENSKVNYPSNDSFEGAEKTLNILYWIIFSMFSEHKAYYSEDDPTFGWDDNEQVNVSYFNGGYNGVPDLWATILTFRFQFEVER
jgi:hypothetical protein